MISSLRLRSGPRSHAASQAWNGFSLLSAEPQAACQSRCQPSLKLTSVRLACRFPIRSVRTAAHSHSMGWPAYPEERLVKVNRPFASGKAALRSVLAATRFQGAMLVLRRAATQDLPSCPSRRQHVDDPTPMPCRSEAARRSRTRRNRSAAVRECCTGLAQGHLRADDILEVRRRVRRLRVQRQRRVELCERAVAQPSTHGGRHAEIAAHASLPRARAAEQCEIRRRSARVARPRDKGLVPHRVR